ADRDGHILIEQEVIEHLRHLGAGHVIVRPKPPAAITAEIGTVVLGVQPARYAGVVRVCHTAVLLGKDRLDGVLFTHILKGVLIHSADALAVHQHILDHIARIRGNGKGFAAATDHANASVRADLSALTGAGRDGVAGGVTSAAAAVAGEAGRDGHVLGDAYHLIAADRAHAYAVYCHIGDMVVGACSDAEALTLASLHQQGAAGADGAVFTGPRRDGQVGR
ncbi:Mn-containing catalase (includes spore coat protein CotJC), partial [Dysosmobacter welbionis]